MLSQIDRYLTGRLLLPWLPMFVLWHTTAWAGVTPQFFGGLAMVLGARVLAESEFVGALQVVFGFLPLLGGALVCANVTVNPGVFGAVYYVAGGLGTTLAAVSSLRERR